MNLEFPLCRQPRHEERIREALQTCVDYLTERVRPPTLVAVILTGSFARGEGSVLPVGSMLKVLGDFEFFVVLTDADRRARQLGAWSREVSARLAGRGVRVDVEFGPVDPGFFGRRARPSIFVYDLLHHGKVLWGRRDMLEGIPRFEADAIPREDALHLMFNRTVEQLDAYERLPELDANGVLDAGYQQLKITLDVAGSVLAFTGNHTALYRRRPAAFARLLAETPSLQAALPRGFPDEVGQAAAAKMSPAEHFTLPVQASLDEQRDWVRRRIVTAVPGVTGVLGWELTRALGRAGSLEKLLERYADSRPLARRVWDWAKFVLNPRMAPLPVSHARAGQLFLKSTPRALLYVAATLAYLELGRTTTSDTIGRLLPLPRSAEPRSPAAQRRAIVALWRWCVRNA